MNIMVNNKPAVIGDGATLKTVSEQYKVPDKGAAIALNGEIIHRELWSSTFIKEGADILIIKAFAGG